MKYIYVVFKKLLLIDAPLFVKAYKDENSAINFAIRMLKEDPGYYYKVEKIELTKEEK